MDFFSRKVVSHCLLKMSFASEREASNDRLVSVLCWVLSKHGVSMFDREKWVNQLKHQNRCHENKTGCCGSLDRKDDVLGLGAFSLRPVEQGVALAGNKSDHAASQTDNPPNQTRLKMETTESSVITVNCASKTVRVCRRPFPRTIHEVGSPKSEARLRGLGDGADNLYWHVGFLHWLMHTPASLSISAWPSSLRMVRDDEAHSSAVVTLVERTRHSRRCYC